MGSSASVIGLVWHAGIRLPSKGGDTPQILCPGSLLDPFLQFDERSHLAAASHASLIPGTRWAWGSRHKVDTVGPLCLFLSWKTTLAS